MLAASITFYLKEPLKCRGSFLISHFSGNTVPCAALIGKSHGTGVCPDPRTPRVSSWGKEHLMLPVCPLVSWDSTKSRMEKKKTTKNKPPRKSWGMLPHCPWPRQSHLPAGRGCSMASSPERLSIPGGVEVPGTSSCPLEPKKEIL